MTTTPAAPGVDALLPCPHGCNSVVNPKSSSQFRHWIECYGGCRGPIGSSYSEARDLWNKRTALSQPAAGEGVAISPNNPLYQRARVTLASRMFAVQRTEPDSGYGRMADELMCGDLMEVPTWIALDALAATMPSAAPTPPVVAGEVRLREALDRELRMQHVAYFDEGQFQWMSGIAPRDCELYAKWPRVTQPAPASDAGEEAVAIGIDGSRSIYVRNANGSWPAVPTRTEPPTPAEPAGGVVEVHPDDIERIEAWLGRYAKTPYVPDDAISRLVKAATNRAHPRPSDAAADRASIVETWTPMSNPPKHGGHFAIGGYVSNGSLPRHFERAYATCILTLDGPSWSHCDERKAHIPLQYWFELPGHPEAAAIRREGMTTTGEGL